MSDIFLSYSRKDVQIMYSVYGYIRAEDLTVWVDKRIKPGTPSWRKAIDQAITEAQCLVVILSPDAKASQWVNEEIDYASMRQKQIFPVLARETAQMSLPFGLSSAQWEDIRGTEYENGMQKIISSIRSTIGKQKSTVRWDRTGSLYWLASDLRLLRNMLEGGRSPSTLTQDFEQCYHHAHRLNMTYISSELQRLMYQTMSGLSEEVEYEYQRDPTKYFIDRIRNIFHEVASLAQQNDPDFHAGPVWKDKNV